MERFLIGINALDDMYPSILYPGSLLVIAGHPGAGKTTLASTVCYRNALNGHKCLYVSFQESKEKIFRVMNSLGMDFNTLESKNVYKYLKVPVIKSVEEVVDIINTAISSWSPRVVIIDSINVLMQVVADSSRRAWLQNYFYSIPEIIGGIAVLIAEVPFGRRRIELGSIEFLADAVIILKHTVERGLLTRFMEIRKARGSPITIAEIPFTIATGRGINVLVPPILMEVGRVGPELKPPCMVLETVLDHIHRGHSIYIEYPPDYRALWAIPLILGIALRNGIKTVIISYTYSSETVLDLLDRAFRMSQECTDIRDRIVGIVKKHAILSSLNPFRYSIFEGIAEEFRIIGESQADVVVFHGIEIPATVERDLPEYMSSLYNQINALKQQQKLVVRIGSKISDELSRIFSALADIVIKLIPNENNQNDKIYIWRRGAKSVLLNSKDVDACLREIASHICKLST
ncbi:MAG: hypothetical protein N3D82_04805 [Ignisphaera sp.]|nr:hypothetical protein [Ignisphaera sp.]